MALHEPYQGLARKWRPQRFEDLVGQEAVMQGLANALRRGQVSHGHLLCGPRGVGKTTTARIIAKALNCEQGPTATPCLACRHCIDIAAGIDLDVIEIDAASNTKVEEMREMLERVIQAPFSSRYKVYIIDEVHMLSIHSFNALLKTLEEPPPHVVFIFATTEYEKVPETVRSRCTLHPLNRLTADDIIRRLTQVAEGEKLGLEPTQAREVFTLIARAVEGGMRDALVIFDQLLALSDGKPTAEAAISLLGIADQAALRQAVTWLAEGQAGELLGLVDGLVNRGRSLERFVKGLIAYLRDLMLLQAGAGEKLVALSGDALEEATGQAQALPTAALFNILNHMFELEEKLKTSTQARFLVEFAFLRLASVKPVVPLDEILKRIGALPEGALGAGVGAGAGAPSAQIHEIRSAPVHTPAQAAKAPPATAIRHVAAMNDSVPTGARGHVVAEGNLPYAAPAAGPLAPAPGAGRLGSLLGPVVPQGRGAAPGGSALAAVAAPAAAGPHGVRASEGAVEASLKVAAPASPAEHADFAAEFLPPLEDDLPATGAAVAAEAAVRDTRTPLAKAQAFLENPEAARRVKMLREMFSGRIIDEHGQPLPVG